MSWATDGNGLGRRSKYIDAAPKPPELRKDGRGYWARYLDLRGDLYLLIARNGDIEFFDCGQGLSIGRQDSASATIGGLGVQLGASRTWSMERNYLSQPCMSCVAVLELTNARLVDDRYFNRKKQLKIDSMKRAISEEAGCERHYLADCQARNDCPGCSGDEFNPSNLRSDVQTESGDERVTVSLSVSSFYSTHAEAAMLSDDCDEWLSPIVDSEEVIAAGGLFVDEAFGGFINVPMSLGSDPRDELPVALLSVALESRFFGEVVTDREAGFPIVIIAPGDALISGQARFVADDDTEGDNDSGSVTQLETRRVGSMSSVVGIIPPVRDGFRNGWLDIRLIEAKYGLSRDWRLRATVLEEGTRAPVVFQ